MNTKHANNYLEVSTLSYNQAYKDLPFDRPSRRTYNEGWAGIKPKTNPERGEDF